METRHIFWFLFVLVIGILTYHEINRKKLYRNYNITTGRIVKYESWKMRRVEFLIDNLELEENASMEIPFPSCGDNISSNINKLKQLKFPVIYSKANKMNHEILIYRKQYEKIGLEVPDSLNSLVDELSNCFNQKK
jgi:hypothetical protein